MENKIILTNQENLSVSGIKKAHVVSETSIVVEVDNSTLQVLGTGMEVKKLDVESGILEVDGKIVGLKFSGPKEKFNLFKKIFK